MSLGFPLLQAGLDQRNIINRGEDSGFHQVLQSRYGLCVLTPGQLAEVPAAPLAGGGRGAAAGGREGKSPSGVAQERGRRQDTVSVGSCK